MEGEVVDWAARAIGSYCAMFHQSKAAVVFQADEPTWPGAAWFRHAVKAFRSEMPSGCATTFAIETRGTLLDDTWMDLFAELGIGIWISLNGFPLVSENGHIGATGTPAYSEAIAAIERIQRHPAAQRLLAGVLCVVNPNEDGRSIYRHLRSLGVNMIDFVLPRDANWDYPPAGFAKSTPFADHLIPIFDEWWSDNHPDVRLGFFDRLLRMVVGNRVHVDSLHSDPLTMVEVDCNGNIEPIGPLHSCSGSSSPSELNVRLHPFERVFQQPALQKALSGQEVLCRTCRACELRDVCGGGYLPSRFHQSNGFDNPSVYCADLAKLIGHVVDSCVRQLAATS